MTELNAFAAPPRQTPAGDRRSRALVAALLTISMLGASSALAAGPTAPVATPGLSAPTIRFLAIGTFTPKAVPSIWKPMIPAEARAAMGLYLEGDVDQWYVKQDNSGIVFILNATTEEKARAIIGKLPAAQSGIMDFQIVGLGPLSPLRTLLSQTTK